MDGVGMLKVLSLGAGVQSSTLLLMACEGELPIDAAIFADTGFADSAARRLLALLKPDQFGLGDLVGAAAATCGHADAAELAGPDPTPDGLGVYPHSVGHLVHGQHLLGHALQCSATHVHV